MLCQAVLVGPLLMAGVTDHDRNIQGDPEKVSDMVHEVSREGLVSLTTASGELALHNSHGQASLVLTTACQPAMDCSFRLVQPITRYCEMHRVSGFRFRVSYCLAQPISRY